MERIALIADIHGNAIALDRVLAELDRRGIDRIYCLGDVAATGPQPHQAIAELRRRNIPTVMGNADAEVLDPPDSGRAGEPMRRILEISDWGSQQLNADDLAFLSNLPDRIEIEFGDGAILCVHGSPRSFNEHMRAETREETLAAMLDGWAAPVVATGHTHLQMLRRFGQQTIINPGAVGLAYDAAPPETGARCIPWAEFAVLESSGVRMTCQFERLPYQVEPVLEAARESGMPHTEWWSGLWRRTGRA